MMFPHPELIIAEGVQLRGELDVVTHLQHRVLADGVMGGEESAEFHASHDRSPNLQALRDRLTRPLSISLLAA